MNNVTIGSKINIKKYLKILMELESEKYRLKEIKNILYSFNVIELSMISNENYKIYDKNRKMFNETKKEEIKQIKNKIECVKNNEFKKILSPNKPKLKSTNVSVLVFFLIISFALLNTCINIAFDNTSVSSDIFLSIVFGIFSIFVIVICINKINQKQEHEKENKKLKEEYEKKINKYQEDVQIYKNKLDIKYDEELALKIKNIEEKYDAKIEEYLNDMENKNKIVHDIMDTNRNLIKILEENLKFINFKLTELYSYDIIFEKYRNLISISMFYEYFASSRVFELEGRDGAYNLFESEMRQNIIIVKLNDISKHLEEIKQNQYCMYKELVDINLSLNILNKNVDSLEKYVSNINENVSFIKEIDKYILVCSEQINKNIEQIKNINMANLLFR